jgi:single-stranded DNA-binding protein
MIFALVTGSLYRSAEKKTSKAGNPFVVATMKIKSGETLQWCRITAFSELTQTELMRLTDGDGVSVQGSLKIELYAKEPGDPPTLSLSIIADQILALRQPPRERKAKAPELPSNDTRSRQERCSGTWAPGGGPNDDIPFGDAR